MDKGCVWVLTWEGSLDALRTVPRAMRAEHLEAKCSGCCGGESARGDLSGRPPPRLSLCMILSRHDSVCLAQELGEESPGWPIKCLAVPRKLLPVSRWRFVTPRQPAGKAV